VAGGAAQRLRALSGSRGDGDRRARRPERLLAGDSRQDAKRRRPARRPRKRGIGCRRSRRCWQSRRRRIPRRGFWGRIFACQSVFSARGAAPRGRRCIGRGRAGRWTTGGVGRGRWQSTASVWEWHKFGRPPARAWGCCFRRWRGSRCRPGRQREQSPRLLSEGPSGKSHVSRRVLRVVVKGQIE
jgi:hypothetical protein